MHAPLLSRIRGVTPGVSHVTGRSGVRALAVIRGTGLLTALGATAGETWDALMAGGYIRDHAPIPLPDDGSGRARVNQLAIRAARQAVGESGWTATELRSDETAIVVGTSKGPIENWTPLPRLVGYENVYGLAETAADVARELGMGRGARLTVSAACATGLHALIRGTMLIESGAAKRVLVVAAESSLGPLFVGSFRRLGVLATDGCRPFDRARTGFLMSEGSAAVCLEAGAIGAGEMGVESYGMGADATHLTGGDREGDTLRHLILSTLGNRPVDFIHAHGTGTEINDATELAAIDRSLELIAKSSSCPVCSHKGALGHSLGAAGLASIALNVLSHRAAIVPPNVRTTSPAATRVARIESNPTPLPRPIMQVMLSSASGSISVPIRRSLAIAAGFGGAAAVVSLVSVHHDD